jgi:hypothetical protein
MYILQDLLAKKSFEALDIKEQEFVLDQMTQDAYEIEQYIVLSSQTLFEEEQKKLVVPRVNPQTLAALKKNKKPSIFIQFIRYQIPAWQAIAASLLLLFGAYQFNTNQTTIPNTIIANETTITDTVFVNKYITQIKEVLLPADTIIKVVYKVLDKTVPKQKDIAPKEKKPTPLLLAKNDSQSREFENVLQYYSTAIDKPISEDTILQMVTSNVIY